MAATAPTWAAKFGRTVRFNDDFSKFFCIACNGGWKSTGSSASNVDAHLNTEKCKSIKLGQTTLKVTTVKSLVTQDALSERIVDFIIDTNASLAVVESPAFHDLALFGKEGQGFVVPSRRTVTRLIEKRYTVVLEQVTELMNNATSWAMRMDEWKNVVGHNFLGIGAELIDPVNLKHYSLLLELVSIDDSDADTAVNLSNHVKGLFAKISTTGDIQKTLTSCTTDTAANILAASRSVSTSLRCLCHSAQLIVKHFLAGDGELADLLAHVQWIAKLSQQSRTFRGAVGSITKGSSVRWASYQKMLVKIYKWRIMIFKYMLTLTGKKLEIFETHFNPLVNGGFKKMFNIILIVRVFEVVTLIGEVGAMTASKVLPTVWRAKRQLAELFDGTGNAKLLPLATGVLATWKQRVDDLVKHYLDPYLEVPIYQAALILDSTTDMSMFGGEEGITLVKTSGETVKRMFEKKYEKENREREARNAARRETAVREAAAAAAARPSAPPAPPAPPAPATGTARAATGFDLARLFALPDSAAPADVEFVLKEEACTFRLPADEFVALIRARTSGRFATGDPLALYKDPDHGLKLALAVALEVLPVSASEAGNEREFAMARSINHRGRASMTPETTNMRVFLKVNTLALRRGK
jgi:hypothetical protein